MLKQSLDRWLRPHRGNRYHPGTEVCGWSLQNIAGMAEQSQEAGSRQKVSSTGLEDQII